MSGGVDSTLAAALLVQDGYRVYGATLVTDEHSMIHAADAAAVSAQLGIRHSVVDVRQAFEKSVIKPFLAAYRQGLTPNPCVYCNPQIKFSALFAEAARLGLDSVATGHFVRVGKHAHTDRWCLFRSLAGAKDQSYFLYRLTQADLARVLFPLARFNKETVREEVAKRGLQGSSQQELSTRIESQDICFIPGEDYRAFALRRGEPFAASHEGSILGEQGNVLGKHDGAWKYTIGQRKGFDVKTTDRLYVIAKDVHQNTITVGPRASIYRDRITLTDLVYSGWERVQPRRPLMARIRSSAIPAPCTAAADPDDPERIEIRFCEPVFAPAAGQSCVLYEDDAVVCGGQIV